MKKSFLAACAVVAMLAASAMAHGPPSVLDPSVVAQTGIDPSVSSGSSEFASTGSRHTIAAHGGGSAGITSAYAGHQTAPVNERMLN